MSAGALADEVVTTIRSAGWEAAAALVEQHWDRLATTDPVQLLAAVKALPADAFLRNPGLIVATNYLEHVAVGGDPRRVHLAMQHGPAATADGLLPRLIMLTNDSAAARVRDEPIEAARIAEAALRELGAAPAPVVAPIGTSLAHLRMQWARSFDAADSPRARGAYEEVYELALATGQPHVARRAAGSAAWWYAERGRTDRSEEWVRRAHATGVVEERYDAPLHLAEGLLLADRDDVVGADAMLTKAEDVGIGEYWAAGLFVRAFLAHNVAAAAIVESSLADHVQRHPAAVTSPGATGRFLRVARVRVMILRGRIPEGTGELVDVSHSDRAVAAGVAYAEGRHHDALALIRPIAEAAEAGADPRLQASALLVQSAAALALGYTDTAVHAFQRADALIQHQRLHTTYDCIDPDSLVRLVDLSGSDTQRATRVASFRRDLPGLTQRENDILALLATDRTAEQIARTLFISPNTLKTMTRRLYRKLGVSSRSAAVDHAHRAGFTLGAGTGP
ncbi:LuxR C-terminal-related transcriptional regulator [Curtobacterium sp. L1-20]|uniref:helix-turn-helix transcriptional regulator n=1 Tax=Curtobacterium sp. L1-20 TaxID=3138181 RepID=UPI003B520393